MRILRLGVITVMVVAGGACTGGSNDAGADGPPTPSGSSTSIQSDAKRGGAAQPLPIEPGAFTVNDRDYRTRSLRPRATFHIPAGTNSFLTLVDWPRVLAMTSRVGSFTLARPRRIFDPTGQHLVPVSEKITEWLEASPHVDAQRSVSTTFAGIDAVQIDAVITSTPGQARQCDRPCLRFLPVGGSPLWFWRGVHVRFIEFSYRGKKMMAITATEHKETFAAINEILDELGSSMRFH